MDHPAPSRQFAGKETSRLEGEGQRPEDDRRSAGAEVDAKAGGEEVESGEGEDANHAVGSATDGACTAVGVAERNADPEVRRGHTQDHRIPGASVVGGDWVDMAFRSCLVHRQKEGGIGRLVDHVAEDTPAEEAERSHWDMARVRSVEDAPGEEVRLHADGFPATHVGGLFRSRSPNPLPAHFETEG